LPKSKRTAFSLAEVETLLGGALIPWVDSETIHEIVHHMSPAVKRAEEVLRQEGLLDPRGEKIPAAFLMAAQIANKTRAIGTPVEDAVAEYFHLKKSSSETDGFDSLIAKGLLDEDLELTKKGWKFAHRYVDVEKLERIIKALNGKIFEEMRRADDIKERWKNLEPYTPTVHSEPAQTLATIQAPENIVQDCQDFLRLARLCIITGAWAGAVQYCSLAVESLLVSVLVSKRLRKPHEEIPALQELTGDVGKTVPQMSSLTKRLVSLIANFRNDSVHPRAPGLRPGEAQARDVYDLTIRLLAEVEHDWFGAPE